jgi:hypothetical protein
MLQFTKTPNSSGALNTVGDDDVTVDDALPIVDDDTVDAVLCLDGMVICSHSSIVERAGIPKNV